MSEISIRTATADDTPVLAERDRHIAEDLLRKKINEGEYLVVYDGEVFIGWLRWNLFWDNTPFMNMLFLMPEYRGKGLGKQLALFWENQMKAGGYKAIMTSTQQTGFAQRFYIALGYKATGGFIPSGESYEIIFVKELDTTPRFRLPAEDDWYGLELEGIENMTDENFSIEALEI